MNRTIIQTENLVKKYRRYQKKEGIRGSIFSLWNRDSLFAIQLPGIAFYGVYKLLFYLILPYGIMATLPVQSMIGEMDGWLALYGILVVAAFTLGACILWKQGLRRYNSTGS